MFKENTMQELDLRFKIQILELPPFVLNILGNSWP